LHKGGPNTGVFLEITRDAKTDLAVSEEELSFRKLEYFQALGDYEALQAKGRRVFRIHLKDLPLASLLEWE